MFSIVKIRMNRKQDVTLSNIEKSIFTLIFQTVINTVTSKTVILSFSHESPQYILHKPIYRGFLWNWNREKLHILNIYPDRRCIKTTVFIMNNKKEFFCLNFKGWLRLGIWKSSKRNTRNLSEDVFMVMG